MTTTTPDVAHAEHDADDAAQAVRTAEDRLASGARGITASALHKLRDSWRHAELAARGARERAERERQEARLAALGQIGAQVDALAQSTGDALSQALKGVSDACAKARQVAAEHDAAVREMANAAHELAVESPAAAGPRKTSAFVAVSGETIIHKRTAIRPLGHRLSDILALAVAGNPQAACADAALVTELPEPRRSGSYFRRPSNGLIFHHDGPLPHGWRTQIAAGELVPLNEREIRAYLEGELR